VSLTTPEKVAQLCELSNIVIGLESFTDIVEHPARSLQEELANEVHLITEACDNYNIYFNVFEELENKASEEEFETYRDELTYLRQFLIYILELKSDVNLSE
jgi:hypothetical protein